MAEHKTLSEHQRDLKRCQGARLRRLRQALGIGQTAAADLTGTTKFKWNHMEAGRHPIDSLALQIFCDAHATGADYVITANKATLRADLFQPIVELERTDAKRAAQSQECASMGQETRTSQHESYQAAGDAASPPETGTRGKSRRKRHQVLSDVAA